MKAWEAFAFIGRHTMAVATAWQAHRLAAQIHIQTVRLGIAVQAFAHARLIAEFVVATA